MTDTSTNTNLFRQWLGEQSKSDQINVVEFGKKRSTLNVNFSQIEMNSCFDFANTPLTLKQLNDIYQQINSYTSGIRRFVTWSGPPRGLEQVCLKDRVVKEDNVSILEDLVANGHYQFDGVNLNKAEWGRLDATSPIVQNWQQLSFKGVQFNGKQSSALLFDHESKQVHPHIVEKGLACFNQASLVLSPNQLAKLMQKSLSSDALSSLKELQVVGQLSSLDELRALMHFCLLSDQPFSEDGSLNPPLQGLTNCWGPIKNSPSDVVAKTILPIKALSDQTLSNDEFHCLCRLGQRNFGMAILHDPDFSKIDVDKLVFRDQYLSFGGEEREKKYMDLFASQGKKASRLSGAITLGLNKKISDSLLVELLLAHQDSNYVLENVQFNPHCFLNPMVQKLIEQQDVAFQSCDWSGVALDGNQFNTLWDKMKDPSPLSSPLKLTWANLTREQFTTLYGLGQRDFSYVIFKGFDFSQAISFKDCQLTQADFSGCDLTLVGFEGCQFSQTKIDDARLTVNQLEEIKHGLQGKTVRLAECEASHQNLDVLNNKRLFSLVLEGGWTRFFDEEFSRQESCQSNRVKLSRVILPLSFYDRPDLFHNLELHDIVISQPVSKALLEAILACGASTLIEFSQEAWSAIDLDDLSDGSFGCLLRMVKDCYLLKMTRACYQLPMDTNDVPFKRLTLDDKKLAILIKRKNYDLTPFDCSQLERRVSVPKGVVVKLNRKDPLPKSWTFANEIDMTAGEALDITSFFWVDEGTHRQGYNQLPPCQEGRFGRFLLTPESVEKFDESLFNREKSRWLLKGNFVQKEYATHGLVAALKSTQVDFSNESSLILTSFLYHQYLQKWPNLPRCLADVESSIRLNGLGLDLEREFEDMVFTDHKSARYCLSRDRSRRNRTCIEFPRLQAFSFERCHFNEINFAYPADDSTKFSGCHFNGVDFSGASLKQATFINCDFNEHCTFINASLPQSLFAKSSPLSTIQQFQAGDKAQRKELALNSDVIQWATIQIKVYREQLSRKSFALLRLFGFMLACWLWGRAAMALDVLPRLNKGGGQEAVSSDSFNTPTAETSFNQDEIHLVLNAEKAQSSGFMHTGI